MSFQLEFDATATHARLAGELTIYSVSEIRQRYVDAVEQKQPDSCEIDLADVSEIDTAGLQLMLLIKKRPGVNTQFIRHSSSVLRLIDLANLGGALGDPMLIDKSTQEAQS
ncbi:MAG: STAS domain-containing protein [Sterolibacterium sp.]|jgi:anti-anti-sigma factor|nr:STAS domain-containing protein [Sterolibacterium sp.]